jgi:hypothetical protein
MAIHDSTAQASESMTDSELDKILSDFEQSEPIIDNDILEKIDSLQNNLELSIRPRRLSLLMLTYSGKELAEMAQNKDKVRCIPSTIQNLTGYPARKLTRLP